MSKKKKLVKAAKVLGGLGAAYVAHELANPTTIDLGPPLRRDDGAAPAPVAASYRTSPYGLYPEDTFKKGGVVSASRRADGIAQRGKTRGKMV